MSETRAMPACIGEPISWLRLETFALSRGDTDRDDGVRDHVAACPACRRCLDEIADDVVALPVLTVPAKRRPWWYFALPACAAAAAVAAILFLLRPRERADEEGVAHVKGLGEVVIDVVRERAGTVRADVRSFAPGDRWKLVVTCAFGKDARLETSIVEQGTSTADHPLAPAEVVCGNRVVIPGAFTLTGDVPHRVCVRVTSPSGGTGEACLTLRPE
jgi:hypothetical protein